MRTTLKSSCLAGVGIALFRAKGLRVQVVAQGDGLDYVK